MERHGLVTDTPLASHPALALTAFGLGAVLAGGWTLVGWARLAVHGTIHPGHYGSTRRKLRTSDREYAPIKKENDHA